MSIIVYVGRGGGGGGGGDCGQSNVVLEGPYVFCIGTDTQSVNVWRALYLHMNLIHSLLTVLKLRFSGRYLQVGFTIQQCQHVLMFSYRCILENVVSSLRRHVPYFCIVLFFLLQPNQSD